MCYGDSARWIHLGCQIVLESPAQWKTFTSSMVQNAGLRKLLFYLVPIWCYNEWNELDQSEPAMQLTCWRSYITLLLHVQYAIQRWFSLVHVCVYELVFMHVNECVHVHVCVRGVCVCMYVYVCYVHVHVCVCIWPKVHIEYPTSLWYCVTTLYRIHDPCNDIHIQNGFSLSYIT